MDELIEDLRAAEQIVFVTGAGMGLASGLATFRGTEPGAIWARDVQELGTWRYFQQDPVGSWRWYLSRFGGIDEAAPNAGHLAVAALERWQVGRGRGFQVITQNIDTLHRKAGTRALIEVHGRADQVRCADHGCRYGAPSGMIPRVKVDFASFQASPSAATLPRCPACGELIRAHVLWFDETYDSHDGYGFEAALGAMRVADLLVFVGTSYSVGITSIALRARCAQWAIDPSQAKQPRGVRHLQAAQDEALPALVAALAR
jgi:NAD-dependent deacetylase